jgi:hypothetical protein
MGIDAATARLEIGAAIVLTANCDYRRIDNRKKP